MEDIVMRKIVKGMILSMAISLSFAVIAGTKSHAADTSISDEEKKVFQGLVEALGKIVPEYTQDPSMLTTLKENYFTTGKLYGIRLQIWVFCHAQNAHVQSYAPRFSLA
jgi:hypothetical protein